MAESIKVVVRFRPVNSREKQENAKVCVKVIQNCLIEIQHPDQIKYNKPIKFPFDTVWDWTATQVEVFDKAAAHLVEQIFDGFNATIFAYGQTGAGKTYSMEGKLGSPHRGIIPRTVEAIFAAIEEADESMEYLLQVSYVEIYLEALRDLFTPTNNTMKIKDGKAGIYIEGVTEMYVRDSQEVIDLMTLGAGNRTVSSTQMNAVSSRSHGVFMLKLTQQNVATGSKRVAKLKMVDLAGAEKVAKTGATGVLLEQAKKINQSLSALGNVMNALSTGKPFIPYRDSVLTRLLSDSLGGNCKTTLLIAVSPTDFNVEETMTTLRFGQRAKKIKNKAKVNAEKTVAEYKLEVADLHARLKGFQMLVKALRDDLKKAKEGNLKVEKSERILHAFDMKDLMTPPEKLGKKKKKKKAKGFDVQTFLDEEKKKKEERKQKKKEAKANGTETKEDENEDDDDNDDNDDDNDNDDDKEDEKDGGNNDDKVSSGELNEARVKLEEAEKRADDAEKEIEDLKKQLFAARALVGQEASAIVQQAHEQSLLNNDNDGLLLPPDEADDLNELSDGVSPLPNILDKKSQSKKRKSILPPPSQGPQLTHRISNTTPKTESELLVQLSKRTSITPRISVKDGKFAFESAKGDILSEENIKPEKIYEKEEINDISDLKPELIEQARRGLLVENYSLRKKTEQQQEQLIKKDKLLNKKLEQLKKINHKLEDTEMDCDRLLMEQEILKERLEAFEKERVREIENAQSISAESNRLKKRVNDLENQLEINHKQTQKTISEIRDFEARRANEFIKKAKIEINKRLRIENAKYEGTTQNDLIKQRKQMDLEMEYLKQQTFERLQQIELEHMKMQQTLQTKIEEYIKLKMKLSEKNDYIKQLNIEIEKKDKIMKRQATELQAFGGLKLQSDQIHQMQYEEAQKTIYQLQKQIKNLKRLNDENGGLNNIKGNWEKFGYQSPQNKNINNIIELQKRQNMPMPLRSKKHKINNKSKTQEFFNNINTNNNGNNVGNNMNINRKNYNNGFNNGYNNNNNRQSQRNMYNNNGYNNINNNGYQLNGNNLNTNTYRNTNGQQYRKLSNNSVMSSNSINGGGGGRGGHGSLKKQRSRRQKKSQQFNVNGNGANNYW